MAENMPTLAAPSELAKAFGVPKIEIEKIEFCKVLFSGGLLKKAMPLTAKKIGEKITRSLNQTGGFQSAASMLKNMNRDSRDEILNNMDERIPDLVREIKSKMFTFDDLADLDNRALQKAMTQVDAEKLPLALIAATDRVREALLGAMSKRAAEGVIEEMDNLGKVKLAEINSAQEAVVAVIREMEESGDLDLG